MYYLRVDTILGEDDDIPPPHQKQSSRTPVRNVSQVKSDFDFLSPVVNLTGLQNFNPACKVCT